MDEENAKIIDHAQELITDTILADIEIIKDRLSYITWISALATGGIALAISQKDKLLIASSPIQYSKEILILVSVSLFISIIIGAFSKYQGQQSIRNNRMMLAMAKTQRFVFYRKKIEVDPVKFAASYAECGHLNEEKKEVFSRLQVANKRWYSEENFIWAQLFLFLLGYIGIAVLAVT
jgi:hypothetical protein